MFEQRLERIRRVAADSAIEACWRQWAALGASATPVGGRRSRSIVDLEALLLLSLDLRPLERRLEAMVGWWAVVGAHLVSVQRLRTLAAGFPEGARAGIPDFASMAADAGHRRWRKHADGSRATPPDRLKGPEELTLIESTTLMARLRAGFGVGVKADLLTFLLGMKGARASVSTIAAAIGYTTTAVRSATDDMRVARLIHGTSDRPVEYFVYERPWAEVLELEPRPIGRVREPGAFEAPVWRHWAPLFGFLSRTRVWAESESKGRSSAYLASSRARDLFEGHREAFTWNGIEVPDPAARRGAEYLAAFEATLRSVADWLESNL